MKKKPTKTKTIPKKTEAQEKRESFNQLKQSTYNLRKTQKKKDLKRKAGRQHKQKKHNT